jgi:RNA polymerase sigma factor (sigma-70 family)
MTRLGDNGRRRLAGVAIRCQPDSRLVGLMREGQDSAFDEIVRRYRAQLVSYAGGIVPEHSAEDVVQEALTRAHSALGRSDAEMNLRPWLYTIVRNGALNALRGEPVHVHLDENYDGVPQPPEVAARREELAALTARVKELPGPQREAIVKRELEGRSHEEIAASLGVSSGAVRGLIYRARAALRDSAGMLIPLPVLRALLSSVPASPEATGTAGAAAAGLTAGGGIALKAGATLGVAVIAVGSGIAIQHRDAGSAKEPAAGHGASRSAGAQGARGSNGVRLADSAVAGRTAARDEGEGSGSSGPGGGHDGSSGSSSGPGSGGHSGASGSSGEGSGTGDGGHGGPGPSGDDGSATSGSGGGSTSGSGDGGGSGGGSTSGSGDGGGSGGGSTSGSGDGGGSGGGGSSGTDGGGGTSLSGSDGGGSSGSGSSGDGGGDTSTTTTTATTTTTTDGDGGGGGTSGGSG